MASIDFYALKQDLQALVDFIVRETDLRVFESYSAYDARVREFRSFEELSAAFDIGHDEHGNSSAVLLQLWSPTVMAAVQFERIALKVPGHAFRYCTSGLGLIQLYFGGDHNGVITHSHYGHWSEAGARQRAVGDPGTVKWPALSRLSGRIQRQIRSKMAVAKVRGRPILPAACAALQGGLKLRYNSLQFDANSPEIEWRATAA
jgi:hypothetical protein